MEFRTFYDRYDNKIPIHTEVIIEHSPVEPNLSLSLEEIFDRWKRNQPLDIVMRNGQYDIQGRELTDEEQEAVFDSVEERSDPSDYDISNSQLYDDKSSDVNDEKVNEVDVSQVNEADDSSKSEN